MGLEILDGLLNGIASREIDTYEYNITPNDVYVLQEMVYNLDAGEEGYAFISTSLKDFLEDNGIPVEEDDLGNYWVYREDLDDMEE